MNLLLALILLPLLGAVVVALLRGNERAAKPVALVCALLEIVLAAAAWVVHEPGGARMQLAGSVEWIPHYGVSLSFGLDGIALVMVAVIALLVPLVLAFSWDERLPAGRTRGGFFALLLLEQALTVAVFAATDVFVFYVLFEIMLIPMYFLIGGYGGQRRQYAAMKFFLYSFLGGLIMLASAIGAYAYAAETTGVGTFDWATLRTVLADAPTEVQVWIFLGFFAAFAIKAPLVPLHTWLPDAAEQAPIGVVVLVVGVLDKVGTFGFLRYSLPLAPDASQLLAPLVLTLGVIGVLYGSLQAFAQTDLKRLIAYVSIAHFGFIALGIFAFTSQAQVGAASYMVNHSIATGMLVLVVGMIIARGGSTRIADYGGMAGATPLLGGMLLIAGLSTLSLPGTNSFISEFLVLIGSFATRPVFTTLATLGLVLAAAYVLRLYQRVMQGPPSGTAVLDAVGGPGAATDPETLPRGDSGGATARGNLRDLSGREIGLLTPLVVLVVLLGVYPAPVLDVITPSVEATMSEVGVTDPVTSQGGN
ncbi:MULTISPECIES: complex I subunit 4 family protein [Actinopolyspora]|uniref:NADH dehydrogenase subunit M n=1 Tax=Actinopolyspora saharensis TaxID=995062 RepID=A0A1H1GFQ4_9ACTN|nr:MULTISPECIES: NADH-quinone oxidoreductase subunit M [Actinopolyspora]NHD16534.1 NADH-quinone oxidoreductase subunit M [Actinopolyspora sp. BKK2]NHE75603.1 NADH-quinone oxidoreductase subunit M [Actinopolyspora sp. BKK1]SDR11676.1 NADH dehydrogenase subunit M [Actinopolyspora saharensis]